MPAKEPPRSSRLADHVHGLSREKAPHRPASWLCLPCRCKGGNIITGLNGKTTQGLSPEDALNQMRCRPNSNVTLTIKSQGADRPLEIAMRRDVIHIQVAKQRMEPGNIGYVRLTEFTEQADTAVKQAVQPLRQQAGGKLKALVLDLRNNPGGVLNQAVAISGDFLARGEIVSTRARHAEEFRVAEGREHRHT